MKNKKSITYNIYNPHIVGVRINNRKNMSHVKHVAGQIRITAHLIAGFSINSRKTDRRFSKDRIVAFRFSTKAKARKFRKNLRKYHKDLVSMYRKRVPL